MLPSLDFTKLAGIIKVRVQFQLSFQAICLLYCDNALMLMLVVNYSITECKVADIA